MFCIFTDTINCGRFLFGGSDTRPPQRLSRSRRNMNQLFIGLTKQVDPPTRGLFIHDDVPDISRARIFDPTKHSFNPLKNIDYRKARALADVLYTAFPQGENTLTVRNGKWDFVTAAHRTSLCTAPTLGLFLCRTIRRWKSAPWLLSKKGIWKHFTLYVKARDKYTSVTCGTFATGYGMGGGHYIARGACGLDYYFSERNVHAQCTRCNLGLEGNRPAYRAYILRTYGRATLTDLESNYHRPTPWTAQDFLDKIALYKEKLKALEVVINY
jgi:hypothetical protein